MRVSVITVSYNCGKTLIDSANSLFQQTYKDIEYIIVDGGSTDGTSHLVKSFGNQVSSFISESDKGIYDALNKGMRIATGQIIGILHADDLFANDKVIKKVVELFIKTKCDLLYGDLQYVNSKNTDKIVRLWKSGKPSDKLLNLGWMPPHPTVFITQGLQRTIGFYNQEYHISSDYDYIIRIFKEKNIKISYLPEVLVKMRIGGKSNRGIKRIFQKSYEDYQIMSKNKLPYPIVSLLYKNISKLSQFRLYG